MSTPQRTDEMRLALQFGLSDRLAKALTYAGIDHQHAAELLGVSRNTIGNYVSGRTRPKRAYIQAWALATGVPLVWLETGHFPGNDENAPAPKSEGGEVGPAGLEPTTSTVIIGRFGRTPAREYTRPARVTRIA